MNELLIMEHCHGDIVFVTQYFSMFRINGYILPYHIATERKKMKIMKSVKRKVFSLRENRKSVTVGHHTAGDHFVLLVYDMLPTSHDAQNSITVW